MARSGWTERYRRWGELSQLEDSLPSPAPAGGSDLHSSLPTWAGSLRLSRGPWGSSSEGALSF